MHFDTSTNQKIVFGREMSKIQPFTFYISSLSNWHYSSIVQWWGWLGRYLLSYFWISESGTKEMIEETQWWGCLRRYPQARSTPILGLMFLPRTKTLDSDDVYWFLIYVLEYPGHTIHHFLRNSGGRPRCKTVVNTPRIFISSPFVTRRKNLFFIQTQMH